MSIDEDENELEDEYSGNKDFHNIDDDKKRRASGDDFFKDDDFEFEGYKDEGTEGDGFRSKRIKQRKRRRKVVFRIIAALFILIVIAAGAVFGYRYIKNRFFSAPEEIAEEDRITIPSSLELGQDINVVIACAGENLDEPEMSSIVFSSYYSSEEKLISLYIPVNTLMDIPGTGAGLISEAAGIGGMERLNETLENNLGLDREVDYYMLLDVYNVVEKLGGVSINLEEAITVKNYDDDSTFDLAQGENLINGTQAVNFLKYFSGIEQDVQIEEIVKQKILLDAIIDKIAGESAEDLSANLSLINDYMDTDLNMEERLKIFSTFSGMDSTQKLPYALGVSPPTELEGMGIVYIMGDISELAQIFSEGGTAAEEEEVSSFKDTVRITILNGAFESPEAIGLASTTSETLEGLKFEDGRNKYEIAEVKNSDNTYEITQILVYTQDENTLAAADEVKQVLGTGVINVREEEVIDSDIVLILGADYLAITTGTAEVETDEQLVKVIVLNGEGTAGLAATATDILEDYFNSGEETAILLEPKSADNFNYTETEITIFTSREGINEVAQRIQERLGVGVIGYSDNNVDNVDISITLGSDYTSQ
ncbi:MAG TPA: LCP family protein [Candidatus Humimicrobiaceae bacterium]|nr:LCP family protein [Candidatus Humimicrobiaceae bacterium]